MIPPPAPSLLASGGARRRPRILFLITRSVHGGAQTHIVELVRGLRSRFEVEVATGQEGDLCRRVDALGVRVHLLPALRAAIRPLSDARALAQLAGLIGRQRPDLVSCHSFKAGLLGRIAASRCGIPVIFTAHGWVFAEGAPWFRRVAGVWLERFAARHGQAVIVVSEADRDLALRRKVARPGQLTVIRNGVSDVPQRATPGERPRAAIVMVARFEHQKDHETLLRALRLLRWPFRATLVGDGPTRPRVEAMARRFGLADRVEFAGDRADVERLLATGDIFVLTSRWEGLPRTILEAMRAGLPVVATDVGGVAEAVVHGETGFVVPRGDARQLVASLDRLGSDPGLRLRLGRAGRQRYERLFTVERMVGETVELYGRLLPAADGSS